MVVAAADLALFDPNDQGEVVMGMNDARGACLATTCHDPLGRFVPGIESAGGIVADVFGGLAVNVTSETHPHTVEALRALDLPTFFSHHGAGTVSIGTVRKDALALGLRSRSARPFYSDPDHILRWLSTSREEVDACLAQRDNDFSSSAARRLRWHRRRNGSDSPRSWSITSTDWPTDSTNGGT